MKAFCSIYAAPPGIIFIVDVTCRSDGTIRYLQTMTAVNIVLKSL
jgi:hypothetical protein